MAVSRDEHRYRRSSAATANAGGGGVAYGAAMWRRDAARTHIFVLQTSVTYVWC